MVIQQVTITLLLSKDEDKMKRSMKISTGWSVKISDGMIGKNIGRDDR